MIKQWVCSGDTHGYETEMRLGNIARNLVQGDPSETAVIILGDAGYNFFLNKSDNKRKKNTYDMFVYCVRGNHEERPENLNYEIIYDENVKGKVYLDPINNKIKYFIDGGEYNLNGHSALVLGGAYSVDKYYRLSQASDKPGAWTGWFKDEQLSEEEMQIIEQKIKGKHYDLVLSHTCPIGWEPTDLFLGMVDQSGVDKSMELWMEKIKTEFDWGIWLFGHFHSDRLERPHVEMFYKEYENLNTILDRWNKYDTTGELDWWLPKSPQFYMEHIDPKEKEEEG